MMNSGRIERLRKFIEDEPNDPFNRYALALEYLSHNPAEAEALLDYLLVHHPDYLPTYYQAGRMKMQNKLSEAQRIFRLGIELARKKMDTKALGELQQALQETEDDGP